MKRFALVAAVVFALVSGLQAQDAARLLRAAMNTEMVDGDLEGAIAQYKKIVASGDRPVAAQALLRMAEVYTKLAQPAARETLQRIVRDYPDQPVATVARTRLSVGAVSRRQEVTPRRVLEGGWAGMLDISADGRFTVGPERSGFSAANIVLRDVASGRATTLVESSSRGSGGQPRISNDGRRVAYAWRDEKDVFSVRVIGTEAGASPETIITGPSNFGPLDWAADGKTVLVGIRKFGDPARPQQLTSTELAWLSVDSKSLRTIKTLESWQTLYNDARVSPDGQVIAFSTLPQPGSSDRYLYVIDAAGQRLSAIVTAAGRHGSPVWTPDGEHLLFVSTTGGRSSLSAVALQNGQTTGAPRVVWPDLAGTPLSMTTSGDFYYVQSHGGDNHEYIVNRSPSPGERPITFPGLSASWSRGGTVAFVRYSSGLDLIIRDVATGQERTYRHPDIGLASPRWLPDGSGVVVHVNPGGEGEKRAAFYLADVQTGNFRRLFDRDANGRVSPPLDSVSLDGKTLFLSVRSTTAGPVTGIVGVDLATAEERPVFMYPTGTGPSAIPGLAVSPDGSTLAVSSWVKPNAVARLFTVGVDGSNYREVVDSYQTGSVLDTVRWTPDGRTILFVAHDANRNWKVMRVPAVGGLVEFDGLSFETLAPLMPDLRMWPGNFNNIDVSPDGTRIIASSLTFTKNELWTLDNLLSVVSSR